MKKTAAARCVVTAAIGVFLSCGSEAAAAGFSTSYAGGAAAADAAHLHLDQRQKLPQPNYLVDGEEEEEPQQQQQNQRKAWFRVQGSHPQGYWDAINQDGAPAEDRDGQSGIDESGSESVDESDSGDGAVPQLPQPDQGGQDIDLFPTYQPTRWMPMTGQGRLPDDVEEEGQEEGLVSPEPSASPVSVPFYPVTAGPAVGEEGEEDNPDVAEGPVVVEGETFKPPAYDGGGGEGEGPVVIEGETFKPPAHDGAEVEGEERHGIFDDIEGGDVEQPELSPSDIGEQGQQSGGGNTSTTEDAVANAPEGGNTGPTSGGEGGAPAVDDSTTAEPAPGPGSRPASGGGTPTIIRDNGDTASGGGEAVQEGEEGGSPTVDDGATAEGEAAPGSGSRPASGEGTETVIRENGVPDDASPAADDAPSDANSPAGKGTVTIIRDNGAPDDASPAADDAAPDASSPTTADEGSPIGSIPTTADESDDEDDAPESSPTGGGQSGPKDTTTDNAGGLTTVSDPATSGGEEDVPAEADGRPISSQGDEEAGPNTGSTTTAARPDAILEKCSMTVAERADFLRNGLSAVSDASLFEDNTSAQYAALTWLEGVDGSVVCPNDDNVMQRYILAVVYYSLGGSSWSNSVLPWLGSVNECSWYGVTCDEESRVTEINLKDNGLAGEIPEELFDLTRLAGLSLDHNKNISGSIPESIINAPLVFVELDDNDLTGTFPTAFYDMVSLKAIDLNDNRLTGPISNEIGNLESLMVLQVENNNLDGPIPSSGLALLEDMVLLTLHGNDFTGSLEEVCTGVSSRRSSYPGYLQFFTSDCTAEMECSCCSQCF